MIDVLIPSYGRADRLAAVAANIHDAADEYRTSRIVYEAASARSADLRRDPHATPREIAKANQASLDAHQALDHARDQLVAAALAHHCDGAS